MNSYDLETTVAAPIQTIGMSYYFDAGTAASAKSQFDMNVFEFYGLGRGGVLGDVDPDVVADAFWFFNPPTVTGIWNAAKEKGAPEAVASSHLDAAYAYADKMFGAIDDTVLGPFARATRKVIDGVPEGRYALFDGYRKFPVPSDNRHAAYLSTILLRELRGGVHIATTSELGISAAQACYLNSEFIFKLHGYVDDQVPALSDDLAARMADAEKLTTTTMAGYLDVLTDGERAAVDAGVAAMNEQLALAEAASKSE